jgi:hypothetical protein
MVAKLLIISVKSLSLPSVLTKVESRHDSAKHASILVFAAPDHQAPLKMPGTAISSDGRDGLFHSADAYIWINLIFLRFPCFGGRRSEDRESILAAVNDVTARGLEG